MSTGPTTLLHARWSYADRKATPTTFATSPTLEALGFAFGKFPHRGKRPGQPSVELEAQIKIRQAKAADLTTEQRARSEQNKRRALEIRAERDESAFWEQLAQAEEQLEQEA